MQAYNYILSRWEKYHEGKKYMSENNRTDAFSWTLEVASLRMSHFESREGIRNAKIQEKEELRKKNLTNMNNWK